jgi:hypothetical protein
VGARNSAYVMRRADTRGGGRRAGRAGAPDWCRSVGDRGAGTGERPAPVHWAVTNGRWATRTSRNAGRPRRCCRRSRRRLRRRGAGHAGPARLARSCLRPACRRDRLPGPRSGASTDLEPIAGRRGTSPGCTERIHRCWCSQDGGPEGITRLTRRRTLHGRAASTAVCSTAEALSCTAPGAERTTPTRTQRIMRVPRYLGRGPAHDLHSTAGDTLGFGA